MTQRKLNQLVQAALNNAGADFAGTGQFGPKMTKALDEYDLQIIATKKPVPLKGAPPVAGVKPQYWKPHKYHPMFDVPAPYTHLHPIDVMRSVAGEKEIPGKEDNGLIAHFHEHAGNLGEHSDDKNDYSDEVPHCASAQNWAQDGAGCEKSNNALASSYQGYAKKFGSKAYKKGDMIPEGAIICIKGHVTRANKAFKWTGSGTFEGFGSNQGNTIKTSTYQQSAIITICDDKPKAGTVLAPIGILGHKPVKATGTAGESTR